MSKLDEFKRSRDFVVCVDSDGCAMDTMNIKHIRCFGPSLVDEWELEPWCQPILDRWNVINLYSGTRGINRFKGLAMMLREVNDRYTPIDGIEELEAWAANAPELSNDAVRKEGEKHEIFRKALSWSRRVNSGIEALPQEEIHPFLHVKEALKAAHEKADVVVVSSANPEAVRAEWDRFGLTDHVDLLCTQEMGSKAYCIARLCEKGYQPRHILMCGDAPGDEAAAEENGVLYYPILVNQENESWQRFLDEGLECFLSEGYAGKVQEQLRGEFRRNLGL